MTKKQTRRAVSVKPDTYAKMREHCEANGKSMSGFLEERIAEFFESKSEPKEESK